MPADPNELNQVISELEAETTRAETVGESVVAKLKSVEAQIIAALEADNAIDAANTAHAVELVRGVIARATANTTKLEQAVLANTPQA